MPIIPDNDPNEAYEIVPCERPSGWWTILCNGIPVHHFAPDAKDKAERYCTDPEYRLSLIPKKFHDQ